MHTRLLMTSELQPTTNLACPIRPVATDSMQWPEFISLLGPLLVLNVMNPIAIGNPWLVTWWVILSTMFILDVPLLVLQFLTWPLQRVLTMTTGGPPLAFPRAVAMPRESQAAFPWVNANCPAPGEQFVPCN